MLFGRLKNYLDEVFHKRARQRESVILEGHLCKDHMYMYIAMPPKYSVAQVVGFIKGKSTIHIAREVERRARRYAGQSFGQEVALCLPLAVMRR